MDNFKEQKEFDKRVEASKQVLVCFPIKGDYQDFIVVDEHGSQKYNGKVIGVDFDKLDYCSCPSFTNNNDTKMGSYTDTHGYAFQCKHILAAREEAGKQQHQVVLIERALGVMEVKPRDTTFDESKLIQRDLLL